ncbi:MAG TPA: tetratricopeptide repeat protein [Pyrinomonadaceae bacterium]|jgi:tetratricopeptide (TPR) repeat protein|nr:tetratricopeptide repeat protein [Pyrinomonadaceae bacterium]
MKTRNPFIYSNHAFFVVALMALFLAPLFSALEAFAQKKRNRSAAISTSVKSITVHAEANATVWLDEVRRGVTDDAGRLTLEKVMAGRHSLRVRALGFRERTLAVAPTQRGQIEVRLTRTTDEAELTFQRAEEAREKAKDDESRRAVAVLYRRAIELRPSYPAAHVGLARILLDLNDYKKALQEIAEARTDRPAYAEASAVEGRIYRYAAFWDDSAASFRRAIREAHGFQPEAHTGLALLLEEKGRNEEATAEFRTALAQLSDTEPVIYQLLGAVYEKMEKYKEAVETYEKYLQLAPEGNLAPAVRSIIDQLHKQAEEQGTQP